MSSSKVFHPRTVDDIFKDFSHRRSAVVRALTTDADEFYGLCDPKKENLCLFGQRNESWEVNLPSEEVPSELPEPALGINFARDGMKRSDWLSLVAIHSDCWLISVAFYFAAGLDKPQRRDLYGKINKLPTVYEVLKKEMNKAGKGKPNVDSGSKSKDSGKKMVENSDSDEDEDEDDE